MHIFIFCVHNVVLDTLTMDFFPFRWKTFFEKRLKLLFPQYDMFTNTTKKFWEIKM